MPWRERTLAKGFGLELSGARLGPDLPHEDRLAVRAAVFRHAVVVLPGQDLSDADLHDFAASIGEVAHLPSAAGMPVMTVAPLTNLDADGKLLAPDAWSVRQARANELWHTDTTYVRPRTTFSMLHARTVPPTGGDTQFCDTRRAFEALAEEEQERLEKLCASHSLLHSRSLAGFDDWTDEDRIRFAPVERPLVYLHVESGRKALCLAAHIADFSGMTREASQALLRELTARATVPENCYAHRWQPGDLVIWDNRCTMHRATPFDGTKYAREMRTIRLVDRSDIAVGAQTRDS